MAARERVLCEFQCGWEHLAFSFVQVQHCFTSTETVGIIRDWEPRTATSTFTQLLSYDFLLVDRFYMVVFSAFEQTRCALVACDSECCC